MLASDGTPAEATLRVLDGRGREFPPLDGGMRWGYSAGAAKQVGPLPPGRFTIRASRADGAATEVGVSVAGEPEQSVELRIDR